MNWRAVGLAGLLPLTGCTTLFHQAAHNLAYEHHAFHGEQQLRHRLRKNADELFQTACGQHPGRGFTDEFHDGFRDGYVDYLDKGGPIQPPAVPPAAYRKPKYLTPDGQAKARDYLLGFGYGAEVAAASGRRAYLLVPVRVTDEPPPPPPTIFLLPAPPDGLSTDPKMPPPDPPADDEP